MDDLPDASFADLCAAAKRITVLTGAGVSTECGVPDFRSPGSPWLLHKPIAFADFLADPATRAEAWRRKFAIDDVHGHVEPGRCHDAMKHLADSGRLVSVVTQNIDGLHRKAGLSDRYLIELHGNGTFARCLSCGRRFELAAVRAHLEQTGRSLDCRCGGFVKSATIAFGQSLEARVIEAAVEAATTCDLFVAVGTSLVVRPAATLPLLAKRSGATLAIVNREATPLDSDADHLFPGEAGDVLCGIKGLPEHMR